MIVTLEQLCTFARENDASLNELAKYADTSRVEMERLVHAHGIPYRKRELGAGASLTDEEKTIIAEMYQAGSTIKSITDRTKRSHKIILAYVRRCGITRTIPKGPGSSLGAERQALMMRMFETGATDAEIADAVGWKENTVRKLRRSIGYGPQPKPAPKEKPKLAPVAAPMVDDAPKKRPADWYLQQWDQLVFGRQKDENLHHKVCVDKRH